MPRRLHDRPILAALAGALAISFSGILYRVADVSPTTGAVFRCLYAVVPLWLLARWEDRRYGPRPRNGRIFAAAAGVFLALVLTDERYSRAVSDALLKRPATRAVALTIPYLILTGGHAEQPVPDVSPRTD